MNAATPGETNCYLVLLFLVAIAWAIDILIRIVFSVRIIEHCFQQRSVAAAVGALGTEVLEMEKVRPKHVREFLIIINNESPRVTLTAFKVLLDEATDERSVRNGSITPLKIDKYEHVPVEIFKDVVSEKRDQDTSHSVIQWLGLCFRPSKPQPTNEYWMSSNDFLPIPSYQETCVNRITKKLAMYRQGIQSNRESSGSSVINSNYIDVVLITGTRADSLAQLQWSSIFSSDTFQVYFPLNAVCAKGRFYQEIPGGIFGFEDNPSPECTVCYDNTVNTVLIPCGHASACERCTMSLRDNLCPICRSTFSTHVVLPVHQRPNSRSAMQTTPSPDRTAQTGDVV